MGKLIGITTNTAPEDGAHIFAEEDAAIYQSIVGEDGVCNIGGCLEATILSNNKIQIADGVLFVGGHFARIRYGETEEADIANGTSGLNRHDIIFANFETTGERGIDQMELLVKEGAPGEIALDPEIQKDDIYRAGKKRGFPLYRVVIDGLSIVAVEKLFNVIPTIQELKAEQDELNSNLANGYIVESGTNDNGSYRKWSDGTLEMWGDYAITVSDYTQMLTSGLYYSGAKDIALPTECKRMDTLKVSVSSNGVCWITNEYKSSITPTFRIAQVGNASRSNNISWSANGKWR